MVAPQVLIVGAGPTGLALALFLVKNGVKPRIIDKNSGPGQASRAMVVQARTLEFYAQLRFADEVVSDGIKMSAAHIWKDGHEAGVIKLGDSGNGQSPYPFVLSYPQDDHERLLAGHLKAVGIAVEWGAELTEFHDDGEQVHATILSSGAEDHSTVRYLCGCDGARSTVRQSLGLGFPGGTYEQIFYVADVEAAGDAAVRDGFSFCLDTNTLSLVFPIRSTGMSRLIGIVPEELRGRDNVTFEDIRPSAEKIIHMQVNKVNWFSTYHVHHRVAEHFRVGSVFVAGDAGHIHSPAGGQGMNTGIGDAVNLAWKLAGVLGDRANQSVLDTYETERLGFAHSLVGTTDKLFQLAVGGGLGNKFFRDMLLPHVGPFLFGFSKIRAAAFERISQTQIHYHDSALSDGAAGDIHGGDRLPWVPVDQDADNFSPLKSADWQIHVYGEATDQLRGTALDAEIALHQFDFSDRARDAGLERDALYLVRPDGYVALADPKQNIERLQGYLDKFKIASSTKPQ